MPAKENPIKVLIRRLRIFIKFLLSGVKLAGFKPYWHKPEIARVLSLSALVNLGMWIFLAHAANGRMSSDYPIILHYNLFFGVDALGNYGQVFLLPLAGLVLFILNALLAQFFYNIERLASYMLTMNIFLIQVILLLASYLIIHVNG